MLVLEITETAMGDPAPHGPDPPAPGRHWCCDDDLQVEGWFAIRSWRPEATRWIL
jgi:hypothetical protein